MEYKNVNGDNFNFLIGKSIVKVEEGRFKERRFGEYVDTYTLTCDDGTIIEVLTNEGCGACCNGWSSFKDLKKLEENNNVITNVETKYVDPNPRNENDEFIMFVYYEDGSLNKLKGDDGYGNGCYGGGFYINIKDWRRENEANAEC